MVCTTAQQATTNYDTNADAATIIVSFDHSKSHIVRFNIKSMNTLFFRGFYMKTSQKRVYPTHTFEEQAASRDQAFQFENPIKDLSVITLR